MRTGISDVAKEYLFPDGKGAPCATGQKLLQAFALNRPSDYGFLEPRDMQTLGDSGFAGIPEWDAFVEHYSECGRCHE
jgi:hypothetical protein